MSIATIPHARERQSTPMQEWHDNWKLVVAAAAGMSLAALSTSSFQIMVVPIEQELHWSRTAIASGPVLITIIVFTLSSFFGNLIDRFGARRLGAISVIAVCSAFALMSQLGSDIRQWWAIWALIGLASAAMPGVWLKPISSRFTAGRGMAMSVVLCGSGLSSFIVPSLGNHLVELYGWRTAYLWLGGIWCCVALPLVVAFLHDGPARDAGQGTTPTGEAMPGLTVREGVRSSKLYRLLIASLLGTFLSTAIALNLVPVLQSTGLASASAAAIAGLMGLSIVGRFASGWLLDRINAGWIAGVAACLASILPLVLLLMPGSSTAAAVAVVIYAVMGGATLPSLAYLVSRHFGPRSFGTFYGSVNAIHSVGVGLGPLLASYVFDRTGSYHLILLGSIPLFAAGAMLYLTLGRYPEFGEHKAA